MHTNEFNRANYECYENKVQAKNHVHNNIIYITRHINIL